MLIDFYYRKAYTDRPRESQQGFCVVAIQVIADRSCPPARLSMTFDRGRRGHQKKGERKAKTSLTPAGHSGKEGIAGSRA